MKKLILCSAAILFAVSGSAFANHHHKGHGGGMKMMDTNGDGMISKEEFMKHHEMMWDKMKKNSAGSVDMKDMEAMHKGMGVKHDMMMKDGQPMKDDKMMMKDGQPMKDDKMMKDGAKK